MFSLKLLKLCIYLSFSLIISYTCSMADTVTQPAGEDLYYTVKKGDTLWDLSDRFLNDKMLWPGFWGINMELTNPHRIFPGQKLKFSGIKKAKTPPSARPVVRKAPPTIVPSYYFSKINRVGFITDKKVESAGTIIGTRKGAVMISQGDLAYINPSSWYCPCQGKDIIFSEKLRPQGTVKNTVYNII